MLLEHIDHLLVGGKDMLAREQFGSCDKTTVAADRIIHRQIVALADDIVLQSMPRCRVHRTGASFEGDMLTENHRHFAIVEAVLEPQSLECVAASVGDYVIVLDIPAVHGLLEQPLGHHQPFFSLRAFGLNNDILQSGVECHSLVGRQRPGRRGPYHQRQSAFSMTIGNRVTTRHQRFCIDYPEADIDSEGLLVLILHLRLRQR